MDIDIQEDSGNNEKVSNSDSGEDESAIDDGLETSSMKPDSEDSLQDSENIGKIKSELATAVEEIVSLKNQNLRCVAEMDNLRKRQAREHLELKKFANEKILEDLLPVIDSLDKAIKEFDAASNELSSKSSFLDGIEMVQKQTLECLKKYGLEKIVSKNANFDPNLHQAIQRQESAEVDVDTISEVYAEGYTLNGRLLRPAMVSVLVPGPKNDSCEPD